MWYIGISAHITFHLSVHPHEHMDWLSKGNLRQIYRIQRSMWWCDDVYVSHTCICMYRKERESKFFSPSAFIILSELSDLESQTEVWAVISLHLLGLTASTFVLSLVRRPWLVHSSSKRERERKETLESRSSAAVKKNDASLSLSLLLFGIEYSICTEETLTHSARQAGIRLWPAYPILVD